MKTVNTSIDKQRVDLDFNDFESCKFNNCNLIYRGYGPTGLKNCKFNNCKWSFDGPALNTINFMDALYNNLACKNLIEATFLNIRQGNYLIDE